MLNLAQSALLFFALGLTHFAAANGEPNSGSFAIVNGQIFTPGLAIVDAPQPYTPEGGDFLQVALDISGDGQLPFPDNPSNSPTLIHNITLFLTSYTTRFNFTISNATNATTAAPLANILNQEPSSTVKHVNWLWPSCLVGNGKPSSNNGLGSNGSARGDYNISIHQSFRLNGSDYYTVFDLPISVTNEIPDQPSSQANGNNPAPGPATSSDGRLDCSLLQNQLLTPDVVNASIHAPAVQPYLGGPIVVSSPSSGGNNPSGTIIPAITATPSNGLGGSGGGSTTKTTTASGPQNSSPLTGVNGNGIDSNSGTSFRSWKGTDGMSFCVLALLSTLLVMAL